MKKAILVLAGLLVLTLAVGAFGETAVKMKVSGPGVINDSTLKAGEKVSFEIYSCNDTLRTGMSLGFVFKSPDIKAVKHIIDSGKGLNPRGDIKGYNGWQDKSVWDMQGMAAVERDWDDALPELIGFGAVAVKQGYKPEAEMTHKLSIEMIVPTPGTLIVDSAFFPPGGEWIFASPEYIAKPVTPKWSGPYKFSVVK
jgi:hypothetical protein